MRRGLAALVALPLVVVACGGGSTTKETLPSTPVSTQSSADAVRTAASKAVLAGSERAVLKLNGAADGQWLRLNGSGGFDNRSGKGTFHLEYTVAGLAGTLDEVVSGTTVYVKSPLFSAFAPDGKTWLRLDARQAAASQGFDLSTFLAQNPARALRALRSLKDVTRIGREDLESGAATHYRARVAASALPNSLRSGPYDVWIGDDGYIHRVRTTLDAKASGRRAAATVVVDLSEFGKPVHVSVPAAAETFTANGVFPGLKG
jgi:hypothetical protein